MGYTPLDGEFHELYLMGYALWGRRSHPAHGACDVTIYVSNHESRQKFCSVRDSVHQQYAVIQNQPISEGEDSNGAWTMFARKSYNSRY